MRLRYEYFTIFKVVFDGLSNRRILADPNITRSLLQMFVTCEITKRAGRERLSAVATLYCAEMELETSKKASGTRFWWFVQSLLALTKLKVF